MVLIQTNVYAVLNVLVALVGLLGFFVAGAGPGASARPGGAGPHRSAGPAVRQRHPDRGDPVRVARVGARARDGHRLVVVRARAAAAAAPPAVHAARARHAGRRDRAHPRPRSRHRRRRRHGTGAVLRLAAARRRPHHAAPVGGRGVRLPRLPEPGDRGLAAPSSAVGAVVAALVTAALFWRRTLPADLQTFLDRFAVGLAASAAVWLTGGPEAAIVLHAVNNVLVFVLAGALGDGVERWTR